MHLLYIHQSSSGNHVSELNQRENVDVDKERQDLRSIKEVIHK